MFNPKISAHTFTDWILDIGISLGFGHWTLSNMAGQSSNKLSIITTWALEISNQAETQVVDFWELVGWVVVVAVDSSRLSSA